MTFSQFVFGWSLSIVLLFSASSVGFAKQLNTPLSTPLSKHNAPQLPLYFEKNHGQHNKSIKYLAQTALSKFAFLDDRVVIQVFPKGKKFQQFQLIFKDVNLAPIINGENQSSYQVNYLRGKKSQWVKNIPTYSRIYYKNIYDNIDLVFYFNQSRLEYDFIVKPGANPDQIAFRYEGIKNIQLNTNDELAIELVQTSLTQKAPIIYQIVNGKRRPIEGRYKNNENNFSFKLAKYDVTKALVIDPVIEFSSYFGGQWEDYASSVVTDSLGNIYLGGATSARARITYDNMMTLENQAMPANPTVDDPVPAHFLDAEHGISLSNEFFGLNNSKIDLNTDEKVSIVSGIEVREDYEYGCKEDYQYDGFFNRDALVTEYDAFISKYDSAYSPQYTTYFGGCRNDGIRDMVIDDNDNLYVAGFTLSEELPVQSFSQSDIGASRFISEPRQSDAFYAKFDSAGVLIYSSYFGGNGRDGARAIDVDSSGALYMTGYTHSTDLTACPVSGTSSVQCEIIGGVELISNDDNLALREVAYYSDAFLVKFSPNGDSREFVSYYGGTVDDWGQAIVVDETIHLIDDLGNADPADDIYSTQGIYVAGNTSSPDILAPFVTKQGFVKKENDEVEFIEFTEVDYAYLAYRDNPSTCSRISLSAQDIARVADGHQCEDIFVTKFNMEGNELEFTTYLGGQYDDNVSDIAIDAQDNIYLVGTSRSFGARLVTGDAYNADELEVELEVSLNADTALTELQKNESRVILAEANDERNELSKNYPLYKNINLFNQSLVEYQVGNTTESKMIANVASESSMAFLTVLGAGANSLIMSTFIGGEEDDAGIGLAINNISNTQVDVYVGGHTISDNFYNQSSFQHTASNSDIFLVNLNLDLQNKTTVYSTDSDIAAADACSLSFCNLYEIKYSTLIGGEDLDALKDLHLSSFDNQVLLAGTTYSKHFPLTTNALKTAIEEISLVDYHPNTREKEFEVKYYPSDVFLTKVSNTAIETNLSMTAISTNTSSVRVGDKINYQIDITNGSSSVDAQSVRLNIAFPYLAADEDVARYVTISGSPICEMEHRQIYCLLGDIPASSTVQYDLSLTTRFVGQFDTTFSLMSLTANADSAVVTSEISTRVRAKPDSGVISYQFLILLLLILYGVRFKRPTFFFHQH